MHVDLVVATVLITVGLSVYAHGLTAVPLMNSNARWFAARDEPPPTESTAAHEHRWRRPAIATAQWFVSPKVPPTSTES
jgi:sodium/hydrogen antiporter